MSPVRLVILFAISIAGCVDLPDIALGSCGNHVVDDGEECDSLADARCIKPPAAGACHHTCNINTDCLTGKTCQMGVCRDAPNTCGNRILDPSTEDCDDDTISCGAPSAGEAACRFVCAHSSPCPAGLRCGKDTVCRKPQSGYSNGPIIGTTGASFQLEDVDGDGYPELIERQRTRLTIHHNDRHGGFGDVLATGATRSSPGLSPRGAAIARQPTDSERPRAIALTTTSGIDLVQLPGGGRIDPLVVGMAEIPEQAFAPFNYDRRLVGVVVDAPNTLPRPLYLNDTQAQLTVYDLPDGYAHGAQATPHLFVDLSHAPCNLGGRTKLFAVISTPPGQASTVVVQGADPGVLCVATPDAAKGSFVVTSLPLAGSGFSQSPVAPVFADVDGDGNLDLVTVADDGTSGSLWWLRNSGGGFAIPELLAVQTQPPSAFRAHALAAIDLDGDRRDELISGADVLLNHTGTAAGFQRLSPSPLGPLADATPFAADLNRDRSGDMALFNLNGQVSAELLLCLGDGSALRFGCDTQVLPLAFYSLHLGDVNGDLTNDVLAVGAHEMGLLLGRPLLPPDPATIVLPLSDRILALEATLRQRPGRLSADVLIDEANIALAHELAIGEADSAGHIQFALPDADPRDAHFTDLDHDGVDDLVTLSWDAGAYQSTLFHTTAGFIHNAIKQPIPDVPPDTLDAQLALVGDDPLPAFVGHLPNGFVVSRLHGEKYQTTITPFPTVTSGFLRVLDLDGDGLDELVLLGTQPAPNVCSAIVGRFTSGVDAPVVTVSVLGHDCQDPIFADINGPDSSGPDGRLDLVLGPGTTGSAVDNALFVLSPSDQLTKSDANDINTHSAVASFANDTRWIMTTDLNGDGLADLLLETPFGIVASLAKSTRR